MKRKWTNFILAATCFAGLGLGTTELQALTVTVTTNGVPVNGIDLTAPTNAISLSATVTGNTGTPTFEWCAENVDYLFGSTTNNDEVIFTNPTGSNTVATFNFVGKYLVTVTVSDSTSQAGASANVTLHFDPNAVFQNIANLLGLTNPNVDSNRFLAGSSGSLTNDEATAIAYYDAIGATQNKATLAAWKSANGITTDPIPPFTTNFMGVVSAAYFNVLDLGLGRRMIMQTNGLAFAVTNYRSVEDAIAGVNDIATVAMDFSSVGNINNGLPFTKFYVYDSANNGAGLLRSAALDGGGQKFVPGLCIVCHGGNVFQAATGNVGAHFLPFDLRAFDYSCSNAFSRAAQEPAFKRLNNGVLGIETNFVGSADQRQALIDLIHGWYGGTVFPLRLKTRILFPRDG